MRERLQEVRRLPRARRCRSEHRARRDVLTEVSSGRPACGGPSHQARMRLDLVRYFGGTYATWTRSMVPVNLNGALS